ncbi:uncharacterized protein [Lolium perenne]|uniref:uncharacterized protein n=1 Tax=Lolium perenne TaxID=4522 RepID=UPI0021F53FC8|nr:uncharacterized protein LOC127339582 [Lolium perenne]
MDPRRRSSSSYRGVPARPNGTFYAEIRSADERIGLGTFETAHEAGCVRRGRLAPRPLSTVRELRRRLDTAAGGSPHAPPAVTREARQRQGELEQRLVFAERDEHMHLEWARRLPKDVSCGDLAYNCML